MSADYQLYGSRQGVLFLSLAFRSISIFSFFTAFFSFSRLTLSTFCCGLSFSSFCLNISL